jgi:hypothetical protein
MGHQGCQIIWTKKLVEEERIIIVHLILCQAYSFQGSFVQTTFPTFR